MRSTASNTVQLSGWDKGLVDAIQSAEYAEKYGMTVRKLKVKISVKFWHLNAAPIRTKQRFTTNFWERDYMQFMK